jgi:hypothetical protein
VRATIDDTNECDACRSRLSVATLILLWLAAMVIAKTGSVRSTLDDMSRSSEQALRVATRVLLWLTIALEVVVLLALVELHRMLTGG